VLRVRIEPGIPKLLVKINPTDAESFHAKNLGEVTLRKGVTSRSQVAVLHMSRGTVAGEVLMSVKLADLLDLEDGEGVEVAAAAGVPAAPPSAAASTRGRGAAAAPRQEFLGAGNAQRPGASLNLFDGYGQKRFDHGGLSEKQQSYNSGLFDHRSAQDAGRSSLRYVHSARGVRERTSLPTRASLSSYTTDTSKDDGNIRCGMERRAGVAAGGFPRYPEADQDAAGAMPSASLSSRRPSATRQSDGRDAGHRASGFGFMDCFGGRNDMDRGGIPTKQHFHVSSMFDSRPSHDRSEAAGRTNSMRYVHSSPGMRERNSLPSRAPSFTETAQDDGQIRKARPGPIGFGKCPSAAQDAAEPFISDSSREVPAANVAAASRERSAGTALGQAPPAPRPTGFGFLTCLGRASDPGGVAEKQHTKLAAPADRPFERPLKEEEPRPPDRAVQRSAGVQERSLPRQVPVSNEMDKPKDSGYISHSWDCHSSAGFPCHAEDRFQTRSCNKAEDGIITGESGASSRAASTPSSPPESSPSEGESGGSSAGSNLSGRPNSSVCSKEETKAETKVDHNYTGPASFGALQEAHEASPRRASISPPLALVPCHGSTTRMSRASCPAPGSGSLRRDSTGLLRKRRSSTLGLLQPDLAEPLDGPAWRNKVPDQWLPPADATLGSLERSELGAEATAEVRRWLLGQTSGQQCSQVILDRALTVLSNFKLASGCELEVLGGPLGALVGGYSDADWLYDEVFQKNPSTALRESFGLLGFRNRPDGDWSSISVEEISLVYRRMCLRGHPSRGGSPKDYLKLQVAMELIKAFCGDAGPLKAEDKLHTPASLTEGLDAPAAEGNHFVLSDLALARELQLSAAEASQEAAQLSAEHLEEMNRALDEYILRQMCFKSEIVDEIARLHEDSAYAILGVSSSATDAEIKKAYRLIAMQCHPDKGGDKEDFQELTNAYEKIMEQRRSSDEKGSKDRGSVDSDGEEPTPVHGKSQPSKKGKDTGTASEEEAEGDESAEDADQETDGDACKRNAQEDATLLEKASKAAEEASRYAKTAAEFAHQAAEAAETARRDQEQGIRDTVIKSVAHSAIVYTLTVVKAVRAVGYATLDVAAQCRGAAKRNPEAVGCADHAVNAMSLGLEALNSALSCAEVTEITAADLQAPGEGRLAERFAGAAVRASLAAAGASNVAMSAAIAAVEGSRQCAKALEKAGKAADVDPEAGADEATEAGEAREETESSDSEPDIKPPPTPKQAASVALQRLVAQRNNNHKVLQRLNAEILGHQRNVREFLCQNRQLIPQVPAESKLKIFRLLRDYATEAWADLSSGAEAPETSGLLDRLRELPLLVPFLQPQSLAIPVCVKARVLKMAALYDLPLAMRLLDEELLAPARRRLSCGQPLKSGSSLARLDELAEKIRSELINNAEEEAAPIGG